MTNNDADLVENIFNCLDDLVVNFLYYDRKEDADVNVYQLERAFEQRLVSSTELGERFKLLLVKTVKDAYGV